MNHDILDWIIEDNKKNPIDYDAIADSALKHAEILVRRDNDNYRLKLQTSKFTHNQIRDAITKNIRKMLNLKLVDIEKKLSTGIIDILAKDNIGNYVGIEVKKKAIPRDHDQFVKYRQELKSIYGEKTRLIILSSCYTEALLQEDYEQIELWRYEIWWNCTAKKTKTKGKVVKYAIEDIRAIKYSKETDYERLFMDKIIQQKR